MMLNLYIFRTLIATMMDKGRRNEDDFDFPLELMALMRIFQKDLYSGPNSFCE